MCTTGSCGSGTGPPHGCDLVDLDRGAVRFRVVPAVREGVKRHHPVCRNRVRPAAVHFVPPRPAAPTRKQHKGAAPGKDATAPVEPETDNTGRRRRPPSTEPAEAADRLEPAWGADSEVEVGELGNCPQRPVAGLEPTLAVHAPRGLDDGPWLKLSRRSSRLAQVPTATPARYAAPSVVASVIAEVSTGRSMAFASACVNVRFALMPPSTRRVPIERPESVSAASRRSAPRCATPSSTARTTSALPEPG